LDRHNGFGYLLRNLCDGPRTGQTATVDTIPQITGLISQDGKTLILVADPTLNDPAHPNINGAFLPQIETVTFSNGDVHPQICHRSRVPIKLGNGKDEKDD